MDEALDAYRLTAAEVLHAVRNHLGDPDWGSLCPDCEADRHVLSDAAWGPGADAEVVAALAAAAGALTHADGNRDDYDLRDCDYDVALARSSAVFGQFGLDAMIGWGPGHGQGPHPKDVRACASCSDWVLARRQARNLIAASGGDPDACLGPDDVPFY